MPEEHDQQQNACRHRARNHELQFAQIFIHLNAIPIERLPLQRHHIRISRLPRLLRLRPQALQIRKHKMTVLNGIARRRDTVREIEGKPGQSEQHSRHRCEGQVLRFQPGRPLHMLEYINLRPGADIRTR